MLAKLSVKNYAIIKHLEVVFYSGFCVLTGETGAGKSIIMGAMGLILGQRADTSVLKDNSGKCVVEGKFNVSENNQLKTLFDENDLDYEDTIILRREISASGKSRAFVNDTPVQLPIMRDIGLHLIDLHSQHSNLELGKRKFQLNVIDWYCGHVSLVNNYSRAYSELKLLEKKHRELSELTAQSKADLDYFQFQFKQLDEAGLIEGELLVLESEQEVLSHSEEIKLGLNQTYQLLEGDEFNAVANIKDAVSTLAKLTAYLSQAGNLHQRLDSVLIELSDIAAECEMLAEKTEYNPEKLEIVNERISYLYSLMQKHRVATVEELIDLRNDFDTKIQHSASFDEELEKLEKNIASKIFEVKKYADELHNSRNSKIELIAADITVYLKQLGMPNAEFKILLNKVEEFGPDGTDAAIFLFSANKGVDVEEISKVASGGELSRLMLAIKTVVAKSKALPAIIFDEIDTGISGEIASKMGNILREMSNYMQVINITHLPQIAARGMSHYLVYKTETEAGVETGLRKLNELERVDEIAKMLSGETTNYAAYENAKALLKG